MEGVVQELETAFMIRLLILSAVPALILLPQYILYKSTEVGGSVVETSYNIRSHFILTSHH